MNAATQRPRPSNGTVVRKEIRKGNTVVVKTTTYMHHGLIKRTECAYEPKA